MKVRFSKNDVVDTKTLADLAADYEDGDIPSVGDTPILEVDLTEEEVGYIKQFVDYCNTVKGNHDGIKFGQNGISDDWSGITITTVMQS